MLCRDFVALLAIKCVHKHAARCIVAVPHQDPLHLETCFNAIRQPVKKHDQTPRPRTRVRPVYLHTTSGP